RRHHHHGAVAVHRARGLPAWRAAPRHCAHARQRSARRCVRRGATGRRRLRRAVAREPAKRAAVTGVVGPAPAVSRVAVGCRVAMSLISLLLNLLWIVFGGLWMALGWVIAAVVMAITIIGLPWARAAFTIAAYTLLPFGYRAVPRGEYFGREDVGTGPLGVIGNIVWLLLAGWWLALGHLVTAVLVAVTIVGIPFAWAHLELAGSLSPGTLKSYFCPPRKVLRGGAPGDCRRASRGTRLSRGVTGTLVTGITVTTLLTSLATASAQNIFEALFGRLWNSPVTSHADPNASSRSPEATHAEGVLAYCVRLCDGRYFPIQRHS